MAKVDAASTSDENRKHWANADGLGPNAALDQGTRMRLRNRGRYEALNNGYCHGLVKSLAYDLVGRGPRPQVSLGVGKEAIAKQIEKGFRKWAKETRLALSLRLAEKACARDGEAFGILTSNSRLKHPVKLYVQWVEAEQCTSPPGTAIDPWLIDGVRFDENWTPLEYYFLKRHPGEAIPGYVIDRTAFTTVAARNVLHWFERDRIGQGRGIPRITAGLPLFAQLRRYTLATLTAAEFAAMIAGIMKTNMLPAGGAAASVDNWDIYELVRGALLTLPEGWEAQQFKPDQPTTTYGDFKREILNEVGRGPGAPLNVVSGNSSQYNYSSGRLDHGPYHRGIGIDRSELQMIVLDPIFEAWAEEAAQIPGYLPADLPPVEDWEFSWNFDGFDSIDPVKDATADDIRLKNGTSTLAEIAGEYGQDWREIADQRTVEKAYHEARGLYYPGAAAPAPPQQAPPEPDDDADPEDAADDAEDATDEAPASRLDARLNGFSLNGNGRHP